MGGLNTNKFFLLVRDFFKVYLSAVKKYSPNTIRSYQKSLELLLDFVKESRQIKLHEITFDMIDRNVLQSFLEYVEKERGCSTSTRNHRLHCIRSFYQYVAETDITVVAYWNEIKKVKAAKTRTTPVKYMSEKAIEAILAQPNTVTKTGMRDMFLMLFLYQSAARVQELLDVKLRDIVESGATKVTLCGKSPKPRTVPLREKFVQHLRKYMEIYHPNADRYSDDFLFFVSYNGIRKRMTEDNVRRMVRKYGTAAKLVCPEVPDNVHPHLFRHSRAMHLYQNGVSLELVSQWLGHSRLETTLIYAYADTEQKRKALENAIPTEGTLKEHLSAARYTITDEDVLKELCGLK